MFNEPDVKRYDLDIDAPLTMKLAEKGEWVRYSDYEKMTETAFNLWCEIDEANEG